MENEVEKTEESAKRISRRSSILKLPKGRNPSEETDSTDTYTDYTDSCKPVRRVSFASSNFVKPFAADPEKNTIWDTTYEEDAYSTQSSQEHNTHTNLGSNLYESVAQVGVSQHITTKLSEEDMEYTNVFSLDKENIQYPQTKFSLVDYARKLSTNGNADVRDKTTRLSQGMELTCSNINPFLKTNENLNHGRQTVLTEIPLCQEIEKIENTDVGDNMEFTCQIPQNNLPNTNNTMTKMRRLISEGNQTEMNSSMEFTCQLSETSSAKISDMEITSRESENNSTKTMAQTMEIDCPSQKHDLTKNGNVELNCQFIQNNSVNLTHVEKTMKVDFQSQEHDLTKQDNVELNCQFVQNNSVNLTHVEKTIAHTVELDCQPQEHDLTKKDNVELNCQFVQDGSMNLTHVEKTVAQTMEFECQPQEHDLTKKDTVELNCQFVQNNSVNLTHIEKVRALDRKISQGAVKNPDISQKVCTTTKIKIDDANSSHRVSHKSLIDINMKTVDESKSELSMRVTQPIVETLQKKSLSAMEIDEISMNENYTDNKIAKMETTFQNSANFGSESNFKNCMKKYNNLEITQLPENICNMTGCQNSQNVLVDGVKCDNEKVSNENNNINTLNIAKSTEKQHFGTKNNILNKTYVKQLNLTENTGASPTPKTTPKNPKVSCIPVKIKLQQDQSNLELNYTAPTIKDTNQLPSLCKTKNEFSVLKTPEQSFRINLTTPSYVDDTQQLLQCTYSNNMSNPVSFVEDKDNYYLSLEDTRHVSIPNLTDVSGCNVDRNLDIWRNQSQESPDLSIFDVPKHSKLSNINDTYVLNNKKFENVAESSYCEEDNSVGIIADDCIQTLANEDHSITKNAIEELKKMYDESSPKVKKVELKKPDLKIRRVSELSGLMKRIEKQRGEIKNYLENFKFRPFRYEQELTILEKNLRDDSQLSLDISEECESCPTVEEKIKEHEKSCQNCWKLEKIDEDYYHFSTLFGTLLFVVRLDVESGKVTGVETAKKLKETAKPFARYVMKLFLDKFDIHLIKSAIGDQFDMLSLLDYVKMTMLRLYRFQREFMWCHKLKMEEDFVATFTVISVPLGRAYDVLVDVSNIENLDFEKDIRIVIHVGPPGAVNKTGIINLAKKCPKGLEFFQGFVNSLQEYVNQEEKTLKKTR